MKEIERRSTFSVAKLETINQNLSLSKSLLSNNGCIYVTGSFGRLEASEGSDLDGFIACRGDQLSRSVSKLEEIKIKADLIHAVEKLSLPDFDGDGDYLRMFPKILW